MASTLSTYTPRNTSCSPFLTELEKSVKVGRTAELPSASAEIGLRKSDVRENRSRLRLRKKRVYWFLSAIAFLLFSIKRSKYPTDINRFRQPGCHDRDVSQL